MTRHSSSAGTLEATPQRKSSEPGDSAEEKIEALSEIIWRAGDESAAALLVLLATLESSTHPKAFANQAKHPAFNHCAELNLYGMIDAPIAVIESSLFSSKLIRRLHRMHRFF